MPAGTGSTRSARGAALVNAGRGGHLVEADLIPALDSGQLSGAVLDVFREEPLPRGHPFWSHPRIIVTPHIAAETHPPTAAAIIGDAIRRFAKGEPVANLVDLATGYGAARSRLPGRGRWLIMKSPRPA